MGNCQAAEAAAAAAAMIEHPGGGRVERVYWSVVASDVMAANPGHYVAVVVAAPRSSDSSKPSSASPDGGTSRAAAAAAAAVAHVKLLRPDDTLLLGRVYRLVAFEDVLKVFGSKKYAKLSKLIAREEKKKKTKLQKRNEVGGNASKESTSETKMEIEKQEDTMIIELERDISADVMTTYKMSKCGLWRPTLQSIAEGES